MGHARRLVADETIAVDDRVAAALVVLYAQPLARIAALTTSDIHRSHDGTVIVDLAGNPVPIHEPFATLIGQLPHRRRNGVSDQPGTPWLFPRLGRPHRRQLDRLRRQPRPRRRPRSQRRRAPTLIT